MSHAQEFMTKERERLNALRAEATVQLDTFAAQITVIDRELAAVDAYEAALEGKKPATKVRATRSAHATGILQVVREKPGATASDIKAALGATDNKTKRTITNLLSALKRTGKLMHTDGRYTIAA